MHLFSRASIEAEQGSSMRKYMRKDKGAGKTEVSEGVRIRARALALENFSLLHHGCPSSNARGSNLHAFPLETQYMELRRRRPTKVARYHKKKESMDVLQFFARKVRKNSSQSSSKLHAINEERCMHSSSTIHGIDARSHIKLPPQGPNLSKPDAPTAIPTQSFCHYHASLPQKRPLHILTKNQRQEFACSLVCKKEPAMETDTVVLSTPHADASQMEVEPCLGESRSVIGFSNRDRQCEPLNISQQVHELTSDSIAVEAPGSTSNTWPSQARPSSAPLFDKSNEAPPCSEIEQFFSTAEQQARRCFINRYNFDPLLEKALRGRYEWSSV